MELENMDIIPQWVPNYKINSSLLNKELEPHRGDQSFLFILIHSFHYEWMKFHYVVFAQTGAD